MNEELSYCYNATSQHAMQRLSDVHGPNLNDSCAVTDCETVDGSWWMATPAFVDY